MVKCAALSAAAAVQTRNRLLNLQKRLERTDRIDDRIEPMMAQHGDQGIYLSLLNEIHGLNTGTRLSAEALSKGRAAEYAALSNDLSRNGVLAAARNGTVERQWGQELYELSKQAAKDPTANPGVTGDPVAQKIAKVIFGYQQLAKNRLNDLGAWIGDYSGYVTRTAHDEDKMIRAGYENWRDFISPRLDEKTFLDENGQPIDREKFLRGVYNGLISAEHTTDASNVGFKDPGFTGPGNLAKRLSEERVLHFRDAGSWMDYQKQFGNGSLLEQTVRNLDRAARQEALLRTWGTNPEAELARDVQFFSDRYHDSNPLAVRYLKDHAEGLNAPFAALTGVSNVPTNRLFAKIGSYSQLIKSLAKLGSVSLTHLSALGTKPMLLRDVGMGLGEQYTNALRSIFQFTRPEETRALADLHLAGFEGMHRDLLGRFSLDDSLPGWASKISNAYFKANLLTPLLNAQKTGTQFAVGRFLGRLADRDFDALPADTQRMLTEYRVSPGEWDALRMAPHAQINGRDFLTPKDAGTDDALALKVHSMMIDLADRSVITPGIRERAFLTGGARPGTMAGELARFVSQFKIWPLAAVNQLLGPLKRDRDIGGVMQLAATSAVLGTMIAAMKDLAGGKNPRPLDDPRTWMRGLAQSGGLGIFGDFLFGEYNREGGGLATTILGPVLGELPNAIEDMWNNAKNAASPEARGHPGRALASEATQQALNNLPFANMFYARRAFDYLLGDSLKEAINPGYLHRREQTLKRNTGQTYWLAPSQNHAQTFGR